MNNDAKRRLIQQVLFNYAGHDYNDPTKHNESTRASLIAELVSLFTSDTRVARETIEAIAQWLETQENGLGFADRIREVWLPVGERFISESFAVIVESGVEGRTSALQLQAQGDFMDLAFHSSNDGSLVEPSYLRINKVSEGGGVGEELCGETIQIFEVGSRRVCIRDKPCYIHIDINALPGAIKEITSAKTAANARRVLGNNDNCTLCEADSTMWCDTVVHDQHDWALASCACGAELRPIVHHISCPARCPTMTDNDVGVPIARCERWTGHPGKHLWNKHPGYRQDQDFQQNPPWK